MDRTTLLDTTVRRWLDSQILGFMMLFPILGVVFLVVALFVGGNGPPGFSELVPWVVLGTLVTSGGCVAYWKHRQRALMLVESNGLLVLELDDAEPIVLAEPFDIRFGWGYKSAGKGPDMTHLMVGFYQDGELVLVLEEFWGAIYGKPEGWPGPVSAFTGAKATYGNSGSSFIVQLVDLLAERR